MAKVSKRSEISIFNEKDVFFFYEKILLVCESNRKGYGKADILKASANEISSSPEFDFEYENYESKMQNPLDNVFYFSAGTTNHSSRRNYSNVVRQWYKHIRNSFAHNYIRIENGKYVFEDYYQDDKKQIKKTLYAQITSLDEFKQLINTIGSKLKK